MRTHSFRRIRRTPPSYVAAVFAIAGALALGGCAAETSPFRGAAKAVNFATDSPEPAPFVAAARQADAGYMPITRELPERPSAPHTPDEVKAMEAGLDATRTRVAADGAAVQAEGRTPPPAPPAPPPAGAK